MRSWTRHFAVVALLFAPASLFPQTPADPSGHWKGAIQVTNPNDGSLVELAMDVDLSATSQALAGTISIPQQKLKDRLLMNIAVNGRSVTFQIAPSNPGDNVFTGELSADGKSIAGTLAYSSAALPFSLTRTGDASIATPARSTAIDTQMEGTWNGTLDVSGRQYRIVMTLANRADGTSAGTLVNLDQNRMEIPITTITQRGATLTLEVKAINGSYASTVNADATALVGTWTEDNLTLPLTFRRAAEGRK